LRVERPKSAGEVLGSLSQATLVTFIALKLAGVVTWSWGWVLSPLWIGGAALALLVGCLVILWCLGRWPVIVMDSFRRRGSRRREDPPGLTQ
jgi:hypothetical protein